MVGFASARNRDGAVVSADALFEEFRLAFGQAHRREVSQILAALLKTREHCGPGRVPLLPGGLSRYQLPLPP